MLRRAAWDSVSALCKDDLIVSRKHLSIDHSQPPSLCDAVNSFTHNFDILKLNYNSLFKSISLLRMSVPQENKKEY